MSAFLSGCISNYQYFARGEVTTVANERRDAVMYWQKDEGRLWYGEKYQQTDSDINIRICQETTKIFALSEERLLELPSKSGDVKVARIDDTGNLVNLETAEQLREGSGCGLILVEGKAVDNDALQEGMRPEVSILCKNDSKPERYPAVRVYQFNAVERKKSDDDRRAPNPCLGP